MRSRYEAQCCSKDDQAILHPPLPLATADITLTRSLQTKASAAAKADANSSVKRVVRDILSSVELGGGVDRTEEVLPEMVVQLYSVATEQITRKRRNYDSKNGPYTEMGRCFWVLLAVDTPAITG